MTAPQTHAAGTIIGFDLTVPDAEAVRDFYAAVVGWQPEPFDMGDYADYFMTSPATGDTVAGVCHARGGNAGLPPQWLGLHRRRRPGGQHAALRRKRGYRADPGQRERGWAPGTA